MSYQQWKQQFFYQRQLCKVTLTRNNIVLQHQQNFQTVSLDFSSSFRAHYDSHGNMTHLVIQANRKICLGHDNPTVLQQWEEILQQFIHKTDFHNQYQLKEKIGEGICASVFLAVRKRDKKKVSVKVFCKSKLRENVEMLALQNQIAILKSIKGEFFPTFKATFVTKNSYYLIYQWCEGISLKQWIDKGLSNQKQMRHIVLQICKGLKQLNSYQIIHRDIKPQNIIYDTVNHKIKIVDFGFATSLTEKTHIYPHCGTPGYAAPEVLDRNFTAIDAKVDIFSLGVTIYFLVFAKLPYSKQSNILKANKEYDFYFDQSLAQKNSLYDLLKRSICALKNRLSLQQLAAHPYLKEKEHQNTRQNVKSQIMTKMRRNQMQELDLMNHKIVIKREERMKRQRISSLRTQSHIRRFSREKSIYNKTRLITQIF